MTLKEFIKSLRVGDAKKFAARLGVNAILLIANGVWTNSYISNPRPYDRICDGRPSK